MPRRGDDRTLLTAVRARLSLDLRYILVVLLAVVAGAVHGDAPTIDPGDDAKHFGDPGKILFWSSSEKVAGFRNMDKIAWTRPVRRGDRVQSLPLAPRDLGSQAVLRRDGQAMSVDEYFERQSVAGLLVLHEGRVVYERYGLGNGPETRWYSFSVTKSVVSMLVGAALRDGYIASVDEKVSDYLPRLKGSPYDDASLRNLLRMASGVAWDETYDDPDSDINRVDWDTLGMYRYLSGLERSAAPGTVFNYNSAETNLVGTLLRSAVGNNLSTYLEQKIWRPFGMEHDAYWALTEPGGGEFGGCCLSATLRDYGRLGLFAMNGGRLADGSSVLAEGWMQESVTPSPSAEQYGYLWWLSPSGAYNASGIFGQAICIHPEERVVVALHSARDAASKPEDWQWQSALCHSLAKAVARGG